MFLMKFLQAPSLEIKKDTKVTEGFDQLGLHNQFFEILTHMINKKLCTA